MGVSDAAIHRVRQKVAAGFSALRLGIVNCVFLKVCYTLDYDATEHCTSFMRDAVLLDDFKAVFPAWYRIHPVSDTVCDRERPVSFLQSVEWKRRSQQSGFSDPYDQKTVSEA